MNNRVKMYQTNSVIRKRLFEIGFVDLYFFPHLRWSKDYILMSESFDGMGWLKNKLYFFQFKTNCAPSKKTINNYIKIEKKLGCKCWWISRIKDGIIIY